MTYFLLREDELSVQAEVTYGTKPGVAAAGDFFKHTSTRLGISRVTETYYRDRDRDNGQASVKEVLTGRQRTRISIDGDLIPSGNAATPTAPDTDRFWKALFGKETTLTAHTTLAAGSTTTVLQLTPGGGAASGIRVGGGDIIVVDVSATYGLQARRVVSRSTDAVTLDRALSEAPAAARAVYVGTTYQLDVAVLPSLYLYLWNGALKYQYPGLMINDGRIDCDFSQRVPVTTQKFAGEAMPEVANADSRPTPTTSGSPQVPTVGKVWFGNTLVSPGVIKCGFNLKNALELRDTESGALQPNAVKRTGQSARYIVEQTIEAFFQDTLQTFYDGAKNLASIDTLVQLGVSVGNIVVFSCPKWKPRAENAGQDEELGLRLTGRALGTTNDDEISLAFI